MTRARKLLANLALLVASATLTLGVAEMALRMSRYAPAAFRHTNRIANGRRTVLLDCYPSNPRGYFPIDLRDAAVRGRYRAQGLHRVDEVAPLTPFAVERRFNTQQFRGGELPPRDPARVRVAVIGDSFTEGMGVKEEDTYAKALERALGAGPKAPGGRGWEVLNCGRRGYDFPALLDLFAEALRLEPDVVVYGMVLNDPVRSAAFQSKQAYVNDWILDRGRMFRGDDPPAPPRGRPRLWLFVQDRWQASVTARETARWYRGLYGEANREGWEQTQGHLREMNRRARERGATLLVAAWPLLVSLEGDDPFRDVAETIARFCVASGIAHHDLRKALAGRPDESLWVHEVDHHPNEVAHRLAGDALASPVRTLVDAAR